MAHSPPTGRQSASASSEPAPALRSAAPRVTRSASARATRRAKRGRRSSGSRLFRYDRGLGSRFVAGADEAGRGCLAGPLVAAAVLFDYEALTLSDLRSLSALNDSKQHTAEGREALYPRVLRAATLRGGDVALRARDRRARAAQDQPRRAVGRARARRARRLPVPLRRLSGAADRVRAAPGRRGRRHERRDRRRIRDRQGHARPLHAPDGGALSRAGSSPRTWATPRRSTARRSRSSASRRCTA